MRLRITMFVLGSCDRRFAGSLYVHGNGFAQPTEFSVELGLGIFVMLIVGGIDSLWGPVLGAAFYVWLPYFLQRLDIQVFGHEIREYNQIIYGAVLLLTMIFFPEGLWGSAAELAVDSNIARHPRGGHGSRTCSGSRSRRSCGRRQRRTCPRRRRAPPLRAAARMRWALARNRPSCGPRTSR